MILDKFAVQERIATRIVDALGVSLTPGEERALRTWGTRNAAAYEEYLKGTARFTEDPNVRENVDAAAAHFRRALAIDAGFAPPQLAAAEDRQPLRADRQVPGGPGPAADVQDPPGIEQYPHGAERPVPVHRALARTGREGPAEPVPAL